MAAPGGNEGLCLEVLGTLRRCLSQQCEVRLALYQVMQATPTVAAVCVTQCNAVCMYALLG